MTREQLVEKVARAIQSADENDRTCEGAAIGFSDDVSDWGAHLARAAIATIAEALRVPIDAMTMAGGKAIIPESVNNTADAYWNANAAWRAMLAASPLVQPEPEPCPKPCERARFNPVNACEECPLVQEDKQ